MSYDSTAGLVGGLLAASALLGVSPAVDPAGEPAATPGVLWARVGFGDPKDGKTPAPEPKAKATAPGGDAPKEVPKDAPKEAAKGSDSPKEAPKETPKGGDAEEDAKAPDPDDGKAPKGGGAQVSRHGFYGILGKLD